MLGYEHVDFDAVFVNFDADGPTLPVGPIEFNQPIPERFADNKRLFEDDVRNRGAYLLNHLSWQRWHLMAGVRFADFKNRFVFDGEAGNEDSDDVTPSDRPGLRFFPAVVRLR